ncbi:MAG: hypothetical protein AAF432_05980 [Planctomycetota bacterium]
MSLMNTASHRTMGSEMLGCGSHELSAIELPELNFKSDRWATTREESVDRTASYWKANPTTVRVFEDPKLSDDPLVMLRKELFEQLFATLKDLTSGRAGVLSEVQQINKLAVALVQAVSDATDRVPAHVSTLAQVIETSANRVHTTIIEATATQTHAIVSVRSPQAPSFPSLSAEEQANIMAELEEEEQQDGASAGGGSRS